MTRIARRLHALSSLTLAGAALGLAACEQQDESAFAPACPHVEIAGDAADLYDYDGRSLDAGSLIRHASMTGLTGNCEAGPKKSVRTRLSVAFRVERGAAASKGNITLPYFVAVLHDGQIIDKKMFEVSVQTPDNISSVTTRAPVRIIDVPAAPDIQDTNYSLTIGFQLTREQLDYNRTHLREANFAPKDN